MTTQRIDGVSFELRAPADFGFLSKYGRVFCAFDRNDSGNISFGVDRGDRKLFIKVAGAHTVNSCIPPEEAIKNLRDATVLYRALEHPHLIRYIGSFSIGKLFVAVFEWVKGECLFDYWNFDRYVDHPELSPIHRFKGLPLIARFKAFDVLLSFLRQTAERGYVAVDFYDGSILYDFGTDTTTLCDIDLFRKMPTVNDMGERFWGTKRLKSPEEYQLNAPIDEITNVFTLGALAFRFFASHTDEQTQAMYAGNAFIPCRRESWEGSDALYAVALKAVSAERRGRYQSIRELIRAWNGALIGYRRLEKHDLKPHLLDDFSRHQRITKYFRKVDGQNVLEEGDFTLDWDEAKKQALIHEDFREVLNFGGGLFGALVDGRVIGFACVDGRLVGSTKEYIQLIMLHVSEEYRKRGVGSALFYLCADEARRLGGEKLYISANPALETQHFYRRVGCVDAAETITALCPEDPDDLKLEYRIPQEGVYESIAN